MRGTDAEPGNPQGGDGLSGGGDETEFSAMTQQVCLSCNHVQSRRSDSCEACWTDNLTERPRRQRPHRATSGTLWNRA